MSAPKSALSWDASVMSARSPRVEGVPSTLGAAARLRHAVSALPASEPVLDSLRERAACRRSPFLGTGPGST